MSLVTRCPQCRTLFRVTPPQLQAAAGQVRCGRCTHVFDGYEALTPHAAPVAGAAVTTAGSGDAAVSRPAADAVPKETVRAQPSVATASVEPSLAAPPVVSAEPPLAAQPPPAARPRAGAPVYVASIVFLMLALTLQAAYAFRAEFAARSPDVRAAMENVCEFAGCSVALPHRPDLLRIEASDVHMIDPSRPSLIQLTATLRSYAKHDLAYPALDLVLTNANEHALARRVFLPDEYLGPGRNPKAGIPPNAEVTIALDLETGNLNAGGFRLDVLKAPGN